MATRVSYFLESSSAPPYHSLLLLDGLRDPKIGFSLT